MYVLCFFFFSSRRRHTRLVSDWSSDVCSSDLGVQHGPDALSREAVRARRSGLSRSAEAPPGGRGCGLELRAVRAPRRGGEAKAERAAEGQEGSEGRKAKDERKGR